MNTPYTPEKFTVTVYIDKNAALLAGRDEYGPYTTTIKPSELTPKQRETLAALNFAINSADVGSAINGTETIEELLDRAAVLRESKQQKIDVENNQCIAEMIAKIIGAPLADRLTIDEETGKITLEHLPGALLCLDYAGIQKTWTTSRYGGVWPSLACGSDGRAKGLRAAALNNPDVTQKIQLAEQKAECIQRKLEAARLKRDAIATEQKAENERLKLDAEITKKIQLSAFVHEHLTEASKARYAAGLMLDGEIMAYIEDLTFKAIERKIPIPEYSRYVPPTDSEVIAYVENALNKEIYSQAVICNERPLLSVTDAEFLRMEKIKAKLHGAKVKPVQHYFYCDNYSDMNDPELLINVVRVTIKTGVLEFSRDYLLSEDWDDAN